MKFKNAIRIKAGLLIGDMGAIFILTVIGGFFHKTNEYNYFTISITSISWYLAWVSIASISRLYDRDYVLKNESLWKSVWVMLLASPIAGFLRGLILGRAIIPLFVGIFGGVLAIGIFIWRLFYLNILKGKSLE